MKRVLHLNFLRPKSYETESHEVRMSLAALNMIYFLQGERAVQDVSYFP